MEKLTTDEEGQSIHWLAIGHLMFFEWSRISSGFAHSRSGRWPEHRVRLFCLTAFSPDHKQRIERGRRFVRACSITFQSLAWRRFHFRRWFVADGREEWPRFRCKRLTNVHQNWMMKPRSIVGDAKEVVENCRSLWMFRRIDVEGSHSLTRDDWRRTWMFSQQQDKQSRGCRSAVFVSTLTVQLTQERDEEVNTERDCVTCSCVSYSSLLIVVTSFFLSLSVGSI